MIYTVTLNPALDLTACAGPITAGGVTRYGQGPFIAGGKGVNVSRLLTSLGMENKALGIVAGFTGEEAQRQLRESGCEVDFIHLPTGCTRINLKLRGEEGVTELNGEGPQVPLSALDELAQRCASLTAGDALVLAGSIPGSLPEGSYARILSGLSGKGVLTVVDAAGGSLREALAHRPFLVKPNLQELAEFFAADITTAAQAADYANELQRMGAQHVVVSMGEKGALLAEPSGRRLFCRAAQGEAVSAVGAGDSLVAGFLFGWRLHGTREGALRWGVAAGCATAFTSGIASGEEVKRLYPLVGNAYPV